MNKGLKAVLIIVSLLLISVLVPVMLMGNTFLNLPFGLDSFHNISRFSFSNYYFSQYLFWVATVFILLLLLMILVIIFYPKTKRSFVLKEDKGTLTLDKKAIEGFVAAKLDKKEFVDSPKVNVKATKNKILVKIKGKLKRTSSLVGKTEALMAEIQNDLQQTLGSSEKVKVDVQYAKFEEEKTNTNTRVE